MSRVWYQTSAGLDRLMDIYETNYSAMRVLLPQLVDWHEGELHVLRPASESSAPEVLAKLLERHAYTTDVWLSYQLSSEHKLPLYIPDFTIRVYHDAQQAEVLQGSLKSHWKITIGERTAVKSRAMVNQVLHKWLQHLSSHQYRSEVALG